MRSYLKVYFDFDERTDELNDSEKARLLLALLRYAQTGEKPVLTGNERFLFPTFKGEVDRDVAVYNVKVSNGNLGGRPAKKETENNLAKPNETKVEPNKTETPKKKNKEEEYIKETTLKGSKEKRERFSPPTVEEVSAYCKERKNSVDAQRFVDFYASKGWRVGQNPMKDWKAAVRTWEQRDSNSAQAPIKQVRANQYQQRDYDEDDLEARLGVNDLFSADYKGVS